MSSIIDNTFTEVVNDCLELYDKHELENCVEKKPKRSSRPPGAPRYHRMETLILLGSILGDVGRGLGLLPKGSGYVAHCATLAPCR
jgi:hypothetical protein